MLVPIANAVDVGTITPFGIENVPPVGVTCIEYELPFVHKLGIGAKVGVAGLIILIDIVRVIGQLIAEGVIKQVYVIIVFVPGGTLGWTNTFWDVLMLPRRYWLGCQLKVNCPGWGGTDQVMLAANGWVQGVIETGEIVGLFK